MTQAPTLSDGRFAGGGGRMSSPRKRREFVDMSGDVTEGVTQIAAIGGINRGEPVETRPHDGYAVSSKSPVCKAAPVMPSMIDPRPGSAIFEREAYHPLGITSQGSTHLSPLLLSGGWSNDPYPMRSEWTAEALRRRWEAQ